MNILIAEANIQVGKVNQGTGSTVISAVRRSRLTFLSCADTVDGSIKLAVVKATKLMAFSCEANCLQTQNIQILKNGCVIIQLNSQLSLITNTAKRVPHARIKFSLYIKIIRLLNAPLWLIMRLVVSSSLQKRKRFTSQIIYQFQIKFKKVR